MGMRLCRHKLRLHERGHQVITTQERIPHARIITRALTYVKHEFRLADGVAEIRRQGTVFQTLTDAHAEFAGGVHRLVGRNDAGEIEVWRVDNLGCGCRNTASVSETAERDVPT
jgi:hypothetical protein